MAPLQLRACGALQLGEPGSAHEVDHRDGLCKPLDMHLHELEGLGENGRQYACLRCEADLNEVAMFPSCTSITPGIVIIVN